MSDTITQEEIFVHTLRRQNSIENLLERIADFHYIYGRDRSWFMADWRGDLTNAVLIDKMTVGPGTYNRTKPMVKKVLAGASEYSACDFSERIKCVVIDNLCKECFRLYEANERQNFLLTLAGERINVW